MSPPAFAPLTLVSRITTLRYSRRYTLRTSRTRMHFRHSFHSRCSALLSPLGSPLCLYTLECKSQHMFFTSQQINFWIVTHETGPPGLLDPTPGQGISRVIYGYLAPPG